MDINNWIKQVVDGTGGFNNWEKYEFPIFDNGRDCGLAAFIIRCLANPDCNGSEEVLAAIEEQRNKAKKTKEPWHEGVEEQKRLERLLDQV